MGQDKTVTYSVQWATATGVGEGTAAVIGCSSQADS
jgi:hypothetical protein